MMMMWKIDNNVYSDDSYNPIIQFEIDYINEKYGCIN